MFIGFLCFGVFFNQPSQLALSDYTQVMHTSLIETEYAMAERRLVRGSPENQPCIKCVYSISWGHPILISPENVCKHQRSWGSWEGLYLAGPTVICNRHTPKAENQMTKEPVQPKPVQRSSIQNRSAKRLRSPSNSRNRGTGT